MAHTNTHVEPIQLQQPDLLCFCEDICLQKVQEPKFVFFLSPTIRLTRQAFLFHYDSLWRFSFFWDVTQRRLIVSNRRFRTTYRSHLQWPSSLSLLLYVSNFLHLQIPPPHLLNVLLFRILHLAG